MDKLEEHRDISLMLLVARSLPEGLPWSINEDAKIVGRERVLWASLSDEEQEQEQKWLQEFWFHRPRHVQVNSKWGSWTDGHSTIEVVDSAFGSPTESFRPYQKGPLSQTDAPRHHRLCEWLWGMGFHAISAENDCLFLIIPNHRVNQEADRLLTLLARNFPDIDILPYGSWNGGVQLRSTYDPVTSVAFIEIFGLDDTVFGEGK